MRGVGWGKFLVAAAVIGTPLPVLAQTYVEPTYDPAYNEPAPAVTRSGLARSRYGSTISLGGGVMNFTGATARSLTNVGGTWDLRLGAGTRSLLGFEVAYVGSAQDVKATGLDPNAALLGTGVEGNLRLNLPFLSPSGLVAPFGFAGAGWTRFDVINDDFNTSGIKDKDHQLMIPVGGGVTATTRGVLFDARFTYRMAYDDEILGGANMNNWMVSANIGSEF